MDKPTNKLRKILVTQALPYANAPLHLGHILEAVQTDIWTRFQNLNGNECLFFCAASAYLTSENLNADISNHDSVEKSDEFFGSIVMGS